MVTIFALWACGAGTRHDITACPLSQTVHAPHSPSAQPSLVPVKPASSRRAFSNVLVVAEPGNVVGELLIVVSIWPVNGIDVDASPPASRRTGRSGQPARSSPLRKRS